LWDVATGRPLHRLREADVPPAPFADQTFLCFSPDSKQLVGLEGWNPPLKTPLRSRQPAILVWDVASGKEIRRFDLLGGTKLEHDRAARYAWFTPGGKELRVALSSGVVRFLDAATGKEIRRWAPRDALRQYSRGAAASPDGKLLALIEPVDGNVVRLFDVLTGEEVRRLRVPGVINIAFSPDSAVLAAADDRSVHLLDGTTGKELKAWEFPALERGGGRSFVQSLTFSADGKVLYCGTRKGQILRWSVPEAAALPAMPDEATPEAFGLMVAVTEIFPSPDGRSVVSISPVSGLIRRWDTATAKEVSLPDGFSGKVCTRLSPDGRLIATGDYDGMIKVFGAATGRPSRTLRRVGPAVISIGWSPDGKRLAAAQANDTTCLWDVFAGQEVRVSGRAKSWDFAAAATNEEAGYPSAQPAFSPDGRQLLTSHYGLCLWDLATGKMRWGSDTLFVGCLSPDGKTVAAFKDHKDLDFLDADSGEVRAERDIESLNEIISVSAAAFSPDGGRLATAQYDDTIRLRDPRTGEERARFNRPKYAIPHSLSFSPDGKWLLAGGFDSVIRLWEAATGKELLRLTGHRGTVRAEFGPGFRTAISSSTDGTVLVWDLRPRGGPAPATAAKQWADLTGDDGTKIYSAVYALADDPKAAAALLREKLPPTAPPDEKRVRQLVGKLDADAFADREKATRELSALDFSVVPLLKKLQAEPGSVESRRRLEDVIEGLGRGDVKDVRHSRAVQVLELAATPEARHLLREWATGGPTAALAEDARAALARLEQADRIRRAADRP
jgi:WD40 repeat protein